jgi:hypothetical protein
MDYCFFRRNLICFFALFLSAGFSAASVENVLCSEHFFFDGLKFNELYMDKVAYAPGDNASINYKLENAFGSPLVEGGVKFLLTYQGPGMVNRLEDGDITNEFFALRDLNLEAGGKYNGVFVWKVPENVKPGMYTLRAFFIVKDKVNIAGLTFMPIVSASSTSFEIDGADKGFFMFDRNKTYFNGKNYLFRAPIPALSPSEKVNIKAFLNNPNKDDVTVSYELYSWDDLETKYAEYDKSETVSDSKELSYDIAGLPSGVYSAKLTASGIGLKSILKVRFYVSGDKGRFAWLGLDRFPLTEKDNSSISFCYFNSASVPGDATKKYAARLELTVSDESGNALLREEYRTENLTALLAGGIVSFLPPRQMTKLKIRGRIYDDKENLADDLEIVYDYSKFQNANRIFELSAPEKAADSLTYDVKYADEYADPLDGSLVVYLSGPDGRVLKLNEAIFSGKYSGVFSLADLPIGVYSLKAVENIKSLKSEKIVHITKTGEQTQTTVAEVTETTPPEASADPGAGNFLWVPILGALVLLIITLVVVKISKNKK